MVIAKNLISLGMSGQGSQPAPVRLFAPSLLSLTTRHVIIGDLKFLVLPDKGFISCKKLTLSKSTMEEPDFFEIVKSWAINDDTEIDEIPMLLENNEIDPKNDEIDSKKS